MSDEYTHAASSGDKVHLFRSEREAMDWTDANGGEITKLDKPGTIEFYVPGIPKTQGSKKAFVHRKTGRAMMLEDKRSELMAWRTAVQDACLKSPTFPEFKLLDGAVKLELRFCFTRPKSHYGTGKNKRTLKDSAPSSPTVKPDVDKLVRAVGDALTGVLWTDDSRIVSLYAEKHYAAAPGLFVTVKHDGVTR